MEDRFEKELDEAVIDIDLENIQTNNSIFYIVSKRIIDIIGSLAGLILLSPLFLIVAILIKLDSNGPIIFKQVRIGKNGKKFNIYKFRSMKVEAPNLSTEEFKNSFDFITKVGRIIRKTSIDELPQLVNILKGDMSIVGPRPVIESETELLELREIYKVNDIVPGITGLAQINGRDDVNNYKKAKYDYEYLKNRSIILDVKIILKTFFIVARFKGVK